MCTLAVYFQPNSEYPLIALANRDENPNRTALAPHIWTDRSGLWAGKDAQAGGTWLGLNSHGVLCGLTNRYQESLSSSAPSRGKLPLIALEAQSAFEAKNLLLNQPLNKYNGFNLFIGDKQQGFLLSNFPKVVAIEIKPGWSLLDNGPIEFTLGNKEKKLKLRWESAINLTSTQLNYSRWKEFADDYLCLHHGELSRTEQGVSNFPICIHSPAYGTVSSSLILVASAASKSLACWTEGPRCQNQWKETQPFASLEQ